MLTKHIPPLPAPAGPPLPDLSSLPADFDWQTYVGINPDLAQAGIITQTAGELAQKTVAAGRRRGLLSRQACFCCALRGAAAVPLLR